MTGQPPGTAPGDTLRLTAVALHQQGRSREALVLLQQALSLNPGDPLIHNNLGSVLRSLGDLDGAVRAFREACRLAPGLAAAWFNLGKLLKAQAHIHEALDALNRALVADPGHSSARWTRGDLLKSLGHIPEAAADYRLACRRDPGSAEAWWGLANLKTLAFRAEEVASLRRVWAREPAPERRALLGFALAKGLEDLGQSAEAFSLLQQANALKRSLLPWDRGGYSRLVDRVVSAFSESPGQPDITLGEGVIFIVGLPRSGSTLLEQMLAAHPQVTGASELPDLPALIAAESAARGRPFPDWTPDATPEDWRRLGRAYLERTRRWQNRPRFTDKLPDNCLYVGAAAAMLPQARFIDTRRDPLDTCLSCYQQHWAKGQAFSYELLDIAHYYLDHYRLVRHWLKLLPERFTRVRYEELVEYPETILRRLLPRLNLSYEAACLQFYTVPRAVRTASAAQVRDPLRTDRRGRWRVYAHELSGLQAALGDELTRSH